MARLKFQDVKNYIENFGYTLISQEYINAHTKMIVECPEGHRSEVNSNNFKTGKRCKECSYKKLSQTKKTPYKDVKAYFEEHGYTLLSKSYEGAHKNLDTICTHGKPHSIRFSHFKNGVRCSCENGGVRHDFEYVKKYIEKQGYQLLDETYINANTKLSLLCDNNHFCSISFHNFKDSHTRCYICSQSKGEEKVAKILEQLNIPYEREFTFKSCKNIFPLPFDFYLPTYHLLIEYDGIQHFEARDYFGGEEAFEQTKLRDSIKTSFCQHQQIDLLRIPYYEFDKIECILKKELMARVIFND